MLPLKRVLCPIDFSEPSLEAAVAAAELSLYFRGRLTCLHVVVPPQPLAVVAESAGLTVSPMPTPEVLLEKRRQAEIRMAEVLHDMLHPQVDLSLRVLPGEPAAGILQVADEIDADLIVIASHGRHGWRRFLYGSVAERVMRASERPVLVVRPGHGGFVGEGTEEALAAQY
jgi:nucleotide-binding universal stress UspA family protein